MVSAAENECIVSFDLIASGAVFHLLKRGFQGTIEDWPLAARGKPNGFIQEATELITNLPSFI